MPDGLRATMLLAAMIAPPAALAADGPGELGALMLATPCLTCHETGAQETAEIPSLAGLGADEMTAALERFRAGDPEATVMTRVAKGYTPQELAVIVAWLADNGATPTAGEAQ